SVTIYRHPIRHFSFKDLDGREKWQSYRFTKNLYDIWMPKHLERICKAIDQLPAELNFGVHGSVHQTPSSTGLSQGMGAMLSEASNDDSSSHQGDSQSVAAPQAGTPETLATQVERTQTSSPANNAKRPHDAI
ncbi:MAG: hypothetical protein Q9169_006206, partial [Polycauliona sp. 2 TL-2023]